MESFDNVLNIAKTICEFIFSHSELVPPEITAFSFGHSSTVVSVRYKGHAIYGEVFKTDATELFKALSALTAETLTITTFVDGLALRMEYTGKGLSEKAREDNAPEGALFRVETKDGKDKFLDDINLFTRTLSPLFEATFPVRPEIEIFFNSNLVKLF